MALSATRNEDGSFEVKIAPFACRLTADHFRPVTDQAARKALFKASVQHVILELSSYCNRRCGFCPNVGLTRIKDENLMPAPLYEKIIRELAEIEFDSSVLFHLYNEPLAAKEVLLERMAYARPLLPNARFGLNTNGDYLRPSVLAALDEAGCDHIFVSIYGPRHGEWDDAYVRRRVLAMARLLKVEGKLREKLGVQYAISGQVGRIRIDIGARNLWKSGYDRGGTIPELARPRKSPCVSPVTEFLVDHRGWVLPCCNVYTDLKDHLDYTLGRLESQTIFDAYAGGSAVEWRDELLGFNPGGPLCGNCSRGDDPLDGSPPAQAALDSVRRGLGLVPLKA
jgi:hypothetical protein